jgi:hypothetical protein
MDTKKSNKRKGGYSVHHGKAKYWPFKDDRLDSLEKLKEKLDKRRN